jgi:hypothetical protein
LFRHYFISNKLQEAVLLGNKLFNKASINSDDLENIFIFPNIRFKAYKIWFFEITKKSKFIIEDYANEILDFCRSINLKKDSISNKIVFHTVAEAFSYSSSLGKEYHQELKNIFKDEFSKIPKNIFEKPLCESLPYFQANGLLLYRP